MASLSYPRPGYNGGFITNIEQEHLLRVTSAEGVYGYPTDLPLVYADGTGGRAVKIRAGRFARVRASLYESGPDDFTMDPLPANTSGQPRMDLIVLRLDRAAGFVVRELAITGVPAANPITPSWVRGFGDADVYDIPIAQVRVESGASTITADKVTNMAWYVGDDGQIRCTSTTRPLHQAGRRIYEAATGIAYMSTGSSWVVVYEDSGPLSFTMASGWALSFGSLRRRNGTVAASLSVRRTGGNLGVSGDVQVATLPAGLQPLSNVEGPAHVLNVGTTIGAYGSNRAVTARLSSGISTNNYVILSPATWHVA